MEKVKILDNNGVQVRSLTKEEKRKLDKYDLDYVIKGFISKIWTAKPEPVVKKKSSKTKLIGLLISLISISLAVVLWLELLDPDGLSMQPYIGDKIKVYMQIIHRLGMFLLWIVVVFSFSWGLYLIGFIAGLKEDKEKIWEPFSLAGFEKKENIRRNFFFIVHLATVFGLIINGYYITTIFYLIAQAIFYGTRQVLKNKVKEQIKEQIGIEV